MIDNLSIVRAVYSGLSQRQAATTHRIIDDHMVKLVIDGEFL